MRVIVVYASRYGSTRGIAEFIAEKLRQRGAQAEAGSVDAAPDLGDYDAVVIGSAVYLGHRIKEAVEFVRRNRTALAGMPVWLFSSGPLELEPEIASIDGPKLEPGEISGFWEIIHPRDHQVFFGALDPGKLGIAHRSSENCRPRARSFQRATSGTGTISRPGPLGREHRPRAGNSTGCPGLNRP